MSDLISAAAISPALLKPTGKTTGKDLAGAGFAKLADEAAAEVAAKRDAAIGKAKDVAQKFEAQFMSSMFQQMFEGLDTDGPFGGGQGEAMFRSLMTEAMGKQVARSGGIGIADTVQREILKLQGLQ